MSAAQLKVTAPLVVVKDVAGVDHYFYRGQVITASVDQDRLAALAEQGLVAGAAAAEVDGPPAKSAKKADWVAYAVSQGVSEAEAKSSSKEDLIDALSEPPGAEQPPAGEPDEDGGEGEPAGEPSTGD